MGYFFFHLGGSGSVYFSRCLLCLCVGIYMFIVSFGVNQVAVYTGSFCFGAFYTVFAHGCLHTFVWGFKKKKNVLFHSAIQIY